MKLWLLERIDDTSDAWDEYLGFVIRAEMSKKLAKSASAPPMTTFIGRVPKS